MQRRALLTLAALSTTGLAHAQSPAKPSPSPSIHNTEPITMDDVIIIGGSFAGLAGALQLGRARRYLLPRSVAALRTTDARALAGDVG